MIAQFLSIMCQGLSTSNINALSAAADSADHATSCYAHIRISRIFHFVTKTVPDAEWPDPPSACWTSGDAHTSGVKRVQG